MLKFVVGVCVGVCEMSWNACRVVSVSATEFSSLIIFNTLKNVQKFSLKIVRVVGILNHPKTHPTLVVAISNPGEERYSCVFTQTNVHDQDVFQTVTIRLLFLFLKLSVQNMTVLLTDLLVKHTELSGTAAENMCLFVFDHCAHRHYIWNLNEKINI